MYKIYLGDLALPIAPAEIVRRVKSRNEVISLINGGQLNMVKGPELTEFKFEAVFPYQKYPFRAADTNYITPIEYISFLEALKEGKTPFYFKIIRLNNKNNPVGKTENIFVTLESFSYSESAENGMDINAEIVLKEYRSYGTVTYYPDTKAAVPVREGSGNTASVQYAVKSGDTLWDICKSFYGDGEKYREVAAKNGIFNPNRIYVGQVINLG